MAGGKLTPRQKMINMMYLVLTALLALNVSREVMDAFYEVMVSQEASIETVEKQNSSIYTAFEAAAAENPVKAGPWRDKANDVKSRSAALYQQIEDLKRGVIEASGGSDEESGDPNKPQKMDDLEASPNYFLIQGNGAKLKAALADYREFMKTEAEGNDLLMNSLDGTFDLSDHKHDGTTISWEQHKFEHFPLISVLTFLTKMQSDVRTSEANVIDYLQKNITASDLKFTGVRTVVMPKSTFVTKGGEYEADVFLAAFDDTQNPTVTINGQELSEEDIVGGVAKVRFPANRVGETTWNGEIKLVQNGEEKVFPVEGAFNVAPPSVVISPTKMNVLYRGVDNPLEISVPGVDPRNVKASGTGVKKSGNSYIADVTRYKGKELKISVSVIEDGKTKNMGNKVFRVKNIPDAVGKTYPKDDKLISANLLKRSEVRAEFKDFDFELPLTVKSFEVVIPPFGVFACKGNKLSSTAKATVEKAKPGTTVVIRNINASTKAGLKTEVSDIVFDIN
ncbi:MAG: gliding motility protein GldM [Schleiferiaceae bacterium]